MGKKKNEVDTEVVAEWFRGTSTFQREAADSLQNALRDDVEQNTTHRVRTVIQSLGLEPPLKTELLRSIMKLSRCNDMAFLYGIMVIAYSKPSGDGTCKRKKYNLNQQIIMSTIAHLDMITTLRELDRILPPGHISKKKQAILDKIEARKAAAQRRANRPKKKREPAILPYFERLVRPKIHKRRLTCEMPDVVTTSIPYEKYLDPHYKVPNQNRWFSTYSTKPSERIVRKIINEEIDKMFCDLEGASARANSMEIICEYHFQQFLNDTRKRNEKLVKMMMQSVGGSTEAYVPNYRQRLKRRQDIKDRLDRDIKKHIDHLRKEKKHKLFKVKVLSGKSEICEQVVEVGNNDPFFKIMDTDMPPCSPVESYADMPGHYLRPCPCSGKKCIKEEKYMAPDCICHLNYNKKEEKKYYEDLAPCKKRSKKAVKQEIREKGGGEKVRKASLPKPLPTTKFRTRQSNEEKDNCNVHSKVEVSTNNITKKVLASKDATLSMNYYTGGEHRSWKQQHNRESKSMVNSNVVARVISHSTNKVSNESANEKKVKLDSAKQSNGTNPKKNEAHRLIGGELRLNKGSKKSTNKKQFKPKTIKHNTETDSKKTKAHRLIGGELRMACTPYHQPGDKIISEPCKGLCNKGITAEYHNRFADKEGESASSDGSINDEKYKKVSILNDDMTPIPSKVFFKGVTKHTPYSFDYERTFRFSNTSITTTIKKTFVKALDPKHVVPPEWEGHPNVIGAAAYNFHKMFKAGVQLKIGELEEEEREAGIVITTDPDYPVNRIKKLFPETYFDADDKELMDRMLYEAIQLMKKNPYFVLAGFPDAHKLPILREWIYRRYGKVYTKEDRIRYLTDATALFQKLNVKTMKARFPPGTEIKAPPQMSYKKRDQLMEKFQEVQSRVMGKMDNLIMDTSREFWFGIHPYILPKGPPNNTFYAYMPARVRDIQHFRLWQPSDYRNIREFRDRKRAEREAIENKMS